MTVSTTPMSITHSCAGTTGPYAFTFGVGVSSDIRVTLVAPDGTETVLTETTHYSVVGTPIEWDVLQNPIAWEYSSGGSVTTVASYAAGYSLRIDTVIPISQETPFTEGMTTLYKSFERALDKLTRIAKQLEVRIIALEISVLSGGTVSPAQINFLGPLASDPDTSGWGVDEEFTAWYNTTDHHAKYWNGSEPVLF